MRENKRLKNLGVPMDRFMELKYFCRQYEHKKRKISEMDFIPEMNSCTVPKGREHLSPSEERAIKMRSLKNDIEMIEQSAKEASSVLCSLIIKHVTEGIDHSRLNAPCGKHHFYMLVERFYIILDKKKKM